MKRAFKLIYLLPVLILSLVLNSCGDPNAIIDKNTFIGNDVSINCGEKLEDGDYDTHTVQDGIVVVKKRAIIPHGTII